MTPKRPDPTHRIVRLRDEADQLNPWHGLQATMLTRVGSRALVALHTDYDGVASRHNSLRPDGTPRLSAEDMVTRHDAGLLQLRPGLVLAAAGLPVLWVEATDLVALLARPVVAALARFEREERRALTA